MEPFAKLVHDLVAAGVRFVVFGVSGANYYGSAHVPLFVTTDQDLFLPPEPENLVKAWATCERNGMTLWAMDEPLDSPRDLWLAERVVARRALTRATYASDLLVDLSLVMAGFEFEEVWKERREFTVEGGPTPVARLGHIVHSKALAGRDKDRLFLSTHGETLRELLGEDPLGRKKKRQKKKR